MYYSGVPKKQAIYIVYEATGDDDEDNYSPVGRGDKIALLPPCRFVTSSAIGWPVGDVA